MHVVCAAQSVVLLSRVSTCLRVDCTLDAYNITKGPWDAFNISCKFYFRLQSSGKIALCVIEVYDLLYTQANNNVKNYKKRGKEEERKEREKKTTTPVPVFHKRVYFLTTLAHKHGTSCFP